MKKLFSVFLASLLLLQLSLFALADSSKSAAAAQQYSLQVIDNVMQFPFGFAAKFDHQSWKKQTGRHPCLCQGQHRKKQKLHPRLPDRADRQR